MGMDTGNSYLAMYIEHRRDVVCAWGVQNGSQHGHLQAASDHEGCVLMAHRRVRTFAGKSSKSQ